jgi:predicted ATPase/DNA-binding winged helix-turn-helix (wHTH) protein
MRARHPEVVRPLRLDLENERVWQGEQGLRLTPKAFSVLHCLIERAGRLVTKEALFKSIWPDRVVSDDALSTCIREIRKVLCDAARAPQYLETVHRRGYRFIGPLATAAPPPGPRPSSLVGREAALGQLHGYLEQAGRGARQVVFITGEPGIGKTAAVEAFVAGAGVRVSGGQYVEHYGRGEPYLPVLEALGRLARGPERESLLRGLRERAPSWLMQLPWLLSPAEREGLGRELLGVTRVRMLRELAELLEGITAEVPLILVLEDLHWSDAATLDALAMLARRREPARLLVLGTYRPIEVIVSGHPLKAVKQELTLHGHCAELALEGLSEGAVAAYLEMRFPGGDWRELARVIHWRTEGQPLFMVNVGKELIARGMLIERAGRWEWRGSMEAVEEVVPESLRSMIEGQFERLSLKEQRVLEVGSVAGVEFSAAAVAAGLGAAEGVKVEACCEGPVRGHWLWAAGIAEWPDGTVAARYGFLHALYQEVLYHRVAPARRVELHRRLGARGEAAYGERAAEIAAELALHFERGRDSGRAIRYLRQAAETASRRCGYREAIGHLTRGLELLQTLPDNAERRRQELDFQLALGPAWMAIKGYASLEVGETYTRAQALCQQVGEVPQRFSVLYGLWMCNFVRAEHPRTGALGEQLLDLAQSLQDSALLLEAHMAQGAGLLNVGELNAARSHLEQGIALYNPEQHCSHAFLYGQDPGVACLSDCSIALWLLGYPEQALKRGQEALTLAQECAHPFSLAFALFFAAWLQQFCREWQATKERAEITITLSTEQGFVIWLEMGTILRGRALAEQGQETEGMAQIHQGLLAFSTIGVGLLRPHFLGLLAEVYEKAGRIEEGLAVLAEALAAVNKSEERMYEAELYRFKGELLWALCEENQAEAESCYHQAMDIARGQSAKSLELRAVMSLSRLLQKQGKDKEARELLAEIYDWFTEGFDTVDLRAARTLLEALKRS